MNVWLLQRIAVGLLVMCAILPAQFGCAQSILEKTTVTYRTVGGHKIQADVYRPAGEDVRPVIVWIHGGALIMGHREGINRQVRDLAEEKGYALVSIDYRLAPETKLPELIGDIEAAFEWLASDGAKSFHLDAERIVVTGGSAGGYLTLVAGYRAQPRPRALVALYGYGDLVGDWYSTPSPHSRHNWRKISAEQARAQTDGMVVSDARQRNGNGGLIYLHYRQNGIWPEEVSGFDRDTIAAKIAPYEPVRNVTADYPPTLLIHGTKDTDVPYEQSTMMAYQLQKHGVPFLLEPIDNGEHGFRGGDAEQIEAAYETMREFIIKHLGE
jgi:acetyl esterase/lipase